MADFTTGIYAEIDDQFNTMSDAVDRFSGLPTVDPTPYETGAPINPVGWVQNAPATGGAATVIIDASGITITDGAITISDYAGYSVLNASGFDGAWTNFLANNVYNGGFDAGVDSAGLTATTIVGTASTAADYRSSLSAAVPHWVVDALSGNMTYGLVSDASYGRGLRITKAVAVGGTVSFFQDVPIVSGTLQDVLTHFHLSSAEFGVSAEVKVYFHPRTVTHAAIGAETSWVTVQASTGDWNYLSIPMVLPINVGSSMDLARYLRVRYEVVFGTTTAIHTSTATFYNVAVEKRKHQWKQLFAPTSTTVPASPLIEDYIASGKNAGLDITVGDNQGGPRPINMTGLRAHILAPAGNATLAFGGTSGTAGTPDASIENSAAGVLRLVQGKLAFPATQAASADVNVLDDYEEGTWTPVLSYSTVGTSTWAHSSQIGRYTKIGNRVYYTFRVIAVPTNGTGSGNLTLSGLPFTSVNVTNVFGQASGEWEGVTKANFTSVCFRPAANATTGSFIASGSGQFFATVAVADVPTGGTVGFQMQGVYEVAT